LDADEKEKHCPDFPYQEYPAIKIARLAVRADMQKRGIGKQIVKYIIGYARSLQDDIGVRFISVDAYKSVADFYKNLGFEHNLHDRERASKQTVSMRFDLEPIVSDEEEEPG
jgi:GNAT superfamily N-acetyltransferase